MWKGINRRNFPRAEYPCKVVVLRNDSNETFNTSTRNIGRGGVGVKLSKHVPRLGFVELLLFLNDGGGPIECTGRIIWVVVVGEKADSFFDTGIEFIDIKAMDQLRIERIVQECLEKEP